MLSSIQSRWSTCSSSARARPARSMVLSLPRVQRSPVRLQVAAQEVATEAPPITVTSEALAQLRRLRDEKGAQGDGLLLRVGVKQGGCSGMSYVMDFEGSDKLVGDDMTLDVEDFKLVVDPKSLLYLFGLRLDYSDALIGGGFKFSNPNATDNCGCGKSFSV